MSKKSKKQTTNGKTESLGWYEFSRNGGTFAEHLNGKLERQGLATFVTSARTGEEQPAPTQMATLRFVPVVSQQSRSSEHPDDCFSEG